MKEPSQSDVTRLAGMLTRVHGGAVLNQQDQFQIYLFIRRHQQNAAAKLAIANKAAVFVNDGEPYSR
jgi:DeoR/GlpR family transcriptional regulator of sugar metabolism